MKKKGLFILIVLILSFISLSYSQSSTSEQGELQVTREHPFLVNNSWIEAKNLQVGDFLTTSNGKKARITSIEEKEEQTEVYNLHVDNTENYFANNILVHNKAVKANIPPLKIGQIVNIPRNLKYQNAQIMKIWWIDGKVEILVERNNVFISEIIPLDEIYSERFWSRGTSSKPFGSSNAIVDEIYSDGTVEVRFYDDKSMHKILSREEIIAGPKIGEKVKVMALSGGHKIMKQEGVLVGEYNKDTGMAKVKFDNGEVSTIPIDDIRPICSGICSAVEKIPSASDTPLPPADKTIGRAVFVKRSSGGISRGTITEIYPDGTARVDFIDEATGNPLFKIGKLEAFEPIPQAKVEVVQEGTEVTPPSLPLKQIIKQITGIYREHRSLQKIHDAWKFLKRQEGGIENPRFYGQPLPDAEFKQKFSVMINEIREQVATEGGPELVIIPQSEGEVVQNGRAYVDSRWGGLSGNAADYAVTGNHGCVIGNKIFLEESATLNLEQFLGEYMHELAAWHTSRVYGGKQNIPWVCETIGTKKPLPANKILDQEVMGYLFLTQTEIEMGIYEQE